jgi:hypothetical protein
LGVEALAEQLATLALIGGLDGAELPEALLGHAGDVVRIDLKLLAFESCLVGLARGPLEQTSLRRQHADVSAAIAFI